MQSSALGVLLTQWRPHPLPGRDSGAKIRRWRWWRWVATLRAASASRPGHPHPAPPAPRRPLLPPAGQASITAPERPPSRLLRAPPLSSLGLPHLHSPGSRLLGKVTSAHSDARGFHHGGSHRRPPRRPDRVGRRGACLDGGAGVRGERCSGWWARQQRERPNAEGRRGTQVGFEPAT